MLRLVFFLAVCGAAFGKLKWGSCPNVKVQEKFDVEQYMGTWYEFERYDVIFERGIKCGRADYTLTSAGAVKVHNSGTKEKDGTLNEITGQATVPDPKQPAKLVVQFDVSVFAKGNYWVLDTDYKTYSVVYSCTNLYLAHVDVVWILSRDRTGLSAEMKDRVHKVLTDNNIDVKPLKKQVQEGCVN